MATECQTTASSVRAESTCAADAGRWAVGGDVPRRDALQINQIAEFIPLADLGLPKSVEALYDVLESRLARGCDPQGMAFLRPGANLETS